ncbi:hypothetical protein HYX13_05475 [Candidatus Woesearchaeota archaeon]|nr:hypothetical protein [Candidatus Woesearchaeota archaeon]
MLVVSYTLQAILFVSFIISLFQKSWLNAIAIVGIIVMTFLPKIIRKSAKVYLPVEFDLFAIIFIFMTIFLGNVHLYYTKFWWWDVLLHSSSGFLLGLGGFLLMYILNAEPRAHVKMKPGFVAIFGFAFALAFGALWEIFEYAMDANFGTNMQRSGLQDTMWDLIVDALGALVVTILGYFYIRKGQFLLFDRMIHRFVEKNPKLFRKVQGRFK